MEPYGGSGPQRQSMWGFRFRVSGCAGKGSPLFLPRKSFFYYVGPAISIGVTSHLRAVVARSDIQSLSSGLGSERSQGCPGLPQDSKGSEFPRLLFSWLGFRIWGSRLGAPLTGRRKKGTVRRQRSWLANDFCLHGFLPCQPCQEMPD